MYEDTKVISIGELKKLAEGEIVELPSFTGDGKINVKLRRPSIMHLIKQKKIPNELLIEANKLFTQGANGIANAKEINDPEMLERMFELMERICEEAFVEPSYKEIREAGIVLTDSQRLAVFAYTQNGVESLKSFR